MVREKKIKETKETKEAQQEAEKANKEAQEAEKARKAQEAEMYKNMNFYERIGVSSSATQAEIRAAYLVLAKKFHPKTGKDEDGGNTEVMQYINEAYQQLKDVDRRQAYDNGSSRRYGQGNRSQRSHSQENQDYQRQRAEEKAQREEEERARREERDKRRKEQEEQRQREEAERKAAEEARLKKERIDGAVDSARKTSYDFKHYIIGLKEKGMTENFIETPEVFTVIKEQAINKAKHGARQYENYVKEWVRNGDLDRSKVDTNRELLDSLKIILLQKELVNKGFAQEFKKEWKEIGIEIK